MVEFNEISVETVVNAPETLDGSKSGGRSGRYLSVITKVWSESSSAIADPVVQSISTLRLNSSSLQTSECHSSSKTEPGSVPREQLQGNFPHYNIAKILESVILKQLLQLFDSNQLFNEQQFGFRQGRSCEDLLLTNVDKWHIARDEGKSVAVAFLNLPMAFNNVNH